MKNLKVQPTKRPTTINKIEMRDEKIEKEKNAKYSANAGLKVIGNDHHQKMIMLVLQENF